VEFEQIAESAIVSHQLVFDIMTEQDVRKKTGREFASVPSVAQEVKGPSDHLAWNKNIYVNASTQRQIAVE
jgi:uncharacterized protein YjbK